MRDQSHKIGILGYGNQGRAQARNLKDSGWTVDLGLREGKSWNLAVEDGFQPRAMQTVVQNSQTLIFLLPDHEIPSIYKSLEIPPGKDIGFCHGYAYHYNLIERISGCRYFLLVPKGPGAMLRVCFEKGVSFPGVYALEKDDEDLEGFIKSYAGAVGLKGPLWRVSFEEETVANLFSEQAVMGGGILSLMERQFNFLVNKGVREELAYFECVGLAKVLVDYFLKAGPKGFWQAVSPTASYGSFQGAKKLFGENFQKETEKLFESIQDGSFAKEWAEQVKEGQPLMKKEFERLAQSPLQKTFEKIQRDLDVQ